jgi:DNA integrity scanning protein DisA with diadenylate cyclase activity
MSKEEILAIKLMVFAQSFVDTLDEFQGTNAFKQRVKMKTKSLNDELEQFLNKAYKGGETDSGVLALLEHCQSAIESVVENNVELID